MQRRIVSLAALVLLAAAPVFGQETFLGNFDPPDCGGNGLRTWRPIQAGQGLQPLGVAPIVAGSSEDKSACNAGSGYLGVFGWALATTGIDRIVIQVDGVDLGRAAFGAPRPDVTAQHPGFLDSEFAGWSYNVNTTLFDNGLHQISAKVETLGGNTFFLHSELILFTNAAPLLEPFGAIERPGANEDVFGTCFDRGFCGDGVCEIGLQENCLTCPADCNSQELGLATDFCCGNGTGPNPIDCGDDRCSMGGFTCDDERQIRYGVVRGWALDLGLTQEDTGISWVELETNGAIVANTRTSCGFDVRTGGLTNCYGLPRLDLETRFPFAFNAPSAGYRFVLDVGALIATDQVTRGNNILTVRSGDISTNFEDIDDIPVNFLCAEEVSEPSFGEIESPRPRRVYSGRLDLVGWALDGEGVASVQIFMDGVPIATLFPGMGFGAGEGTRPLVAADYPGFQDTAQPVWRFPAFDTTQLTNGTHSMQVRVNDEDGNSVFIGGEVVFRVFNAD